MIYHMHHLQNIIFRPLKYYQLNDGLIEDNHIFQYIHEYYDHFEDIKSKLIIYKYNNNNLITESVNCFKLSFV